MPELPEVETYRRYFESTALGRRVASVAVPEPRILSGIGARALRGRLRGRTFTTAARHGKYLFAGMSEGGFLVLHFGMTGDLAYVPAGEPLPPYARFVLEFEGGGRLAYVDPRKFGRVAYAADVGRFVRERRLGPDPCLDEPGPERLRAMLRARSGGIKAAFLDQRFLAGIGNLYADEILYRAGIHPATPARALTAADADRLGAAIPAVLDAAIRRNEADADAGETDVFGFRREGTVCPECGGRVRRGTVAGRTTYWCPRHQRRRGARSRTR